ncbi:uncharacterized protein NPIL_351921 [Nephila pilipes]|uniref:Uncharacterized protein n=1 Tax=Nephila pilipes TaxID=299642 RepID=A0A8X6QXS5_NEPPI|nr:uncharacterized protein NPIL_351921 [Nephila pilipes]
MRFEHGSHRTECLAALIVLLLLCCCCSAADVPPPFGTFRQCLHLDEDVGPWEACGAQGRSVRLRFCDAYEPARLVRACNAGTLARLREKDEMAREAACRFRKLLDRYDCENANSVSWTCKDCEVSILLNPLSLNLLCDHSKVHLLFVPLRMRRLCVLTYGIDLIYPSLNLSVITETIFVM